MARAGQPRGRGRSGRDRRRDDRGAVVIEAAIVLPLLFMMVFGILEIGSALKSYSGAANAVRAGGRMASVAGNQADADRMILERVADEAAGIPNEEIEYVVVWHAASTGELPPALCMPTVVESQPNDSSRGIPDGGPLVNAVGACNVYHRPADPNGAFDMARGEALNPDPAHYFGCTGPSDADSGHKVDCNWPGSNRKTTITPRDASPFVNPDYVGIYIKAQHNYVTGVLGDSLTITDASVNLIEPQGYSVTE